MPSNTFATSGRDLVGHCIDNGRLEFLSVLGLGAYGVVYLAVDLHAPKPVYLAVKCLLRAGLDSRQRHFQRREIALHQLASRHPNVVTLHKVLEEGDYVFVVMDFCDEGDLFGMITEKQRYIGHDNLIRKVFLQIVDAVEYCHSMGIFHRDLKPENILCTRGGERICIADFGLATSERSSTDFGCGSTFYLSPECQGGLFERLESYNTANNDIWSLGVILVNLTCGRNPWRQACPSDETFRAYVHNPDFLRTILPISHATNRILKGLFTLEPRNRMTLRELRKHILAVETFTMTEDELRTAHSAARAAAAAVRPIQPLTPIVVQQPQAKRAVAAVQVADVDMDVDHVHPADRQWSSSSAFADLQEAQIDEAIFQTIDFSPPPRPQARLPNSPPHPRLRHPQPQTPRHIHRPAPISIPSNNRPTPMQTPQLIEPSSSYALAATSSRSSSSADVSLPPTPQFNPADKTVSPSQVSRWEMGKVHQGGRPELLRVNPPSPSTADFPLI